MRVLALSGSLRPGSHNRALLRAVERRLPSGVEMTLWERLGELPAYAEHLDGPEAPPVVADLRAALAGADAVLIATPEYNASLPGALKNALDWASRPYPANALRDTPAAVIGASTGLFGAVWAQAEARKVLSAIGARVVADELPVGQADTAFDDNGALAEPELRRRLDDLVAALLREASAPLRKAA